MKRRIIIHKHLFKNAGSTFDWILKQNFGEAFYDHRDDVLMRNEGYLYLKDYLKKNNQIKALSSHNIWFHFEPDEEIELIPVYFIRHPIERTLSVYNFERIQQSDTPGAIMAKKTTFFEYVKWRMGEDTQPTIRNFQTRYLAGQEASQKCTEISFKKALDELKTNKFIGIVDQFNLSMSYFENEFKNIGFNLNLTEFEPQNVWQQINFIDIEKRVADILFELGELADLVLQNNEFDISIYKYACELHNRRYQNSKNLK